MKTRFLVNGMHCTACASSIERTVRNLPGASGVYVNFAAKVLMLDRDPEQLTPDRIVQAVKEAGFEAREIASGVPAVQSDEEASPLYFLRFLIAMVFSFLLFLVAMYPEHSEYLLKWSPLKLSLLQLFLLLPVLGTGYTFYTSGFKSLVRFSPNMDSLVALCTSAAVLFSAYLIFRGRFEHLYFDTAGMILSFIMLGKFLEARSMDKASGAVRELMKLTPETARRIENGQEVPVTVSELKTGDLVRVRPGERIPADGVVTEGESSVDESILTGESMPVLKEKDSPVTGGAVNGQGVLLCKVTRVGQDTTVARIIAMVQDAQGSRPPVAKLADRVSGYFVWVVILIALTTFSLWLFAAKAPFSDALEFTLAVLVIACPCALGLATPIALIVGLGRGARLGILIKNGAVLEAAGKLTCIAFDKTGTVTEGHPAVREIRPAEGISENDLLSLAASAEIHSNHPLAGAVSKEAEKRSLPLQATSKIQEQPGFGLSCVIDGKEIRIGNAALMKKQGIELPSGKESDPVIHVSEDGKYRGAILVSDPLKPTSVEAIGQLQGLGIKCVMLTGDQPESAARIAAQLNLDHFQAQLLPGGKAEAVRFLQQNGEKVGMVGDGINDAPALTQADVGFSISSGTDIAMESAGIVLMRNDLREAPAAIALSRATLRVIRQNLFWAFIYNLICIPLAAGVFYHWLGWKLSPVAGAMAMALSSVSVVANALRLIRFQPVRKVKFPLR